MVNVKEVFREHGGQFGCLGIIVLIVSGLAIYHYTDRSHGVPRAEAYAFAKRQLPSGVVQRWEEPGSNWQRERHGWAFWFVGSKTTPEEMFKETSYFLATIWVTIDSGGNMSARVAYEQINSTEYYERLHPS